MRCLETVRGVVVLVLLGGATACLVNSTVGATGVSTLGFAAWHDYSETWLTWWSGDLLGVILAAPLLLAWMRDPPQALSRFSIEAVATLVVALVVLRDRDRVAAEAGTGEDVDLAERPASRGELNRFAQKFGVRVLIDPEAKRYRELGLSTAARSDERWLDLLIEEPLLLRMPLVRHGNQLTVGLAEAEWREWTAR